ncbi:MAG: CBS domain-containing protein [Planctomycetes bacterium]|nr:CBS domain-containing protein [Planctomycetota bacterium]
MKPWQLCLIPPATTIHQTIRVINDTALQIALVVDATQRLLGTVTDGDVRRALLAGIALTEPVDRIMNPRPTTVPPDADRQDILELMRSRSFRQLPVVDAANTVLGLETLDHVERGSLADHEVVILAGGFGKRLMPLTEHCPKPMLKVGSRPLLESTLDYLRNQGFRTVHLCVNYRAEVISDHFGDGSRFGLDIRYVREDRPLGTAGALGLLPAPPIRSFLVMNADLLMKVNFEQLFRFHGQSRSMGTMCVREYDFQVPYGVVRMESGRILGIDEKPVQRFFVNAGMYVLEPEALALLPKGEPFDMPSLFERMIGGGSGPGAFPIHEYWLDIGKIDDFERANSEFATNFPG